VAAGESIGCLCLVIGSDSLHSEGVAPHGGLAIAARLWRRYVETLPERTEAVVGGEVLMRIPQLSQDDQLELAEQFPPGTVSFEDAEVPEGAFGDLGLSAAIVILSAVALKAFVSWLALRHQGEQFEEKIEISKGDLHVTRTIKRRKGEPIDKAVVHELSTVPGLDVSALLAQGK